MSDQIDSCTAKGEQPLPNNKTGDLESKLPDWSSMNLLSVNMGKLMEKILKITSVDDALKTEDMTYINNALI
jgi:hypothetical protein